MARGERGNLAMGAGTMAPSRFLPPHASGSRDNAVRGQSSQLGAHWWHAYACHSGEPPAPRCSARGTARLGCPRRPGQHSPGEQARRVPWLWQWAQCPTMSGLGVPWRYGTRMHTLCCLRYSILCSLVSQILSRCTPRGGSNDESKSCLSILRSNTISR